MNLQEYTEIVGERIQEWIDKSLTFDNGCKRFPEEFDNIEEAEFSWFFTQKGQKLYESYLKKAQRLIEMKYPKEDYEDLERYTGVLYA